MIRGEIQYDLPFSCHFPDDDPAQHSPDVKSRLKTQKNKPGDKWNHGTKRYLLGYSSGYCMCIKMLSNYQARERHCRAVSQKLPWEDAAPQRSRCISQIPDYEGERSGFDAMPEGIDEKPNIQAP